LEKEKDEYTFHPSLAKPKIDYKKHSGPKAKKVEETVERMKQARAQRDMVRIAMERGYVHDEEDAYFRFGKYDTKCEPHIIKKSPREIIGESTSQI